MNDKIKEKINYYKLWLGILVITDIGLISWYINNYKAVDRWMLYGSITVITFLSISSFIIHIIITKNINKIKNYD